LKLSGQPCGRIGDPRPRAGSVDTDPSATTDEATNVRIYNPSPVPFYYVDSRRRKFPLHSAC
jgi:hypothetical protein